MTRQQALKIAEKIYIDLLRSGDPKIFEAARGADGRIDKVRLVAAAIRAKEKLADEIMNNWEMTQ